MSRTISVALAGLLVVVLAAAPSYALTDRWAAWSPVTGATNDYALTMSQQSPGFPAATVVSDSRSPVQLPTGASSFLGPATPPGAKYGSSAGNPYLVLRPRADTPTAPSTTTYTFDTPTPDTGWAFVLGDIDSDQVRLAATDVRGAPVPAAEIDSWFRGTFNYAGAADQPTWDAATSTLVGNPGAVDTDGAAGWFEPDVRLTSLTMTFTRRAGFPVYQTWFVSRARPIGGTVDDVSTVGQCPPDRTTLTLVSPFGDALATTVPAADGSYTFGELATQDGYVVRLDVPVGCSVVGTAERVVSNRGEDGDPDSRADFGVRAVVAQPISGTVRDDAGAPVAGVTATLTGPGGTTTTTTTTSGSYLFADNPAGTGYAVSIALPDGYAAGPAGTRIAGIAVADAPVTGQDFTVVRQLAPVGSPPDVDLTLDKRVVGDPRVTAGAKVRYRLSVRNRGTGAASGPIRVTDALPRGLELVAARGKGWSCRARLASDRAVCVLAPGLGERDRAAAVVVVARTARGASGRVVNVARVRVADESRRSDNRGTAAITVVPAQLPATGFRLAAAGV